MYQHISETAQYIVSANSCGSRVKSLADTSICLHFLPFIVVVIIIMFMNVQACILFLDPQDEVAPSISSSIVLCSFVPLVYIVVLILVVYIQVCPSSVGDVATFPGIVLFPLLYSVLPFFLSYIDSFLYLVLLFPLSVSKISSVLLLNFVPLISSVPRLHFQISMLLQL